MTETKIHTIFIDTKIDKSQNPSKFKVKLNNCFLRNNIKNNDGSKSEWFMSIKTVTMMNSFSNVSTGINDKIILYVAKDETKPELQLGINEDDYIKEVFFLPEGNPNVDEITLRLNAFLKTTYKIECFYDSYNSTFVFQNIKSSTDLKKIYFDFANTYDLLGFTEGSLYFLNNTSNNFFRSDRNVNLLADRLIKFSLGTNSDFCIKNMSYCNHGLSGLFSECSIFFMLPVNALPYDIISYERASKNYIPIELYKNSIREFQINATNNDNGEIEGLADYIMILEFIQIKTFNYEYKIYKLIKEIYMWLAMTLINRI
jgi:hypothetical protein